MEIYYFVALLLSLE